MATIQVVTLQLPLIILVEEGYEKYVSEWGIKEKVGRKHKEELERKKWIRKRNLELSSRDWKQNISQIYQALVHQRQTAANVHERLYC